MIKKISSYVLSASASLMPMLVSAQTSQNNLTSLINKIIGYANQILVLMMGVAVVMFVYYVIKYFIKADADRTDGGKYVMYSVVGFFIILSFWGIVNILQNTFGLQNNTNRPAGWQSFTDIFPSGSSGSPSSSRFNDGNPPCTESGQGPGC